jgi:leucyl-tRNA synthetase
MRDLGLVKFDEPFTNLFTQGMLLAECFYREDADGKKRWFFPHEITIKHDDKGRPIGATAKEDGQPVMLGGMEKMSKAKNNGVEPKDIIERFGADTARAYVMFAGPPEMSAAANHDYARLQYNTVVSAGMKMLNALEDSKAEAGADWDAARFEGLWILLRMFYPIAPHITWQLWNELGFVAAYGEIIDAPWPEPDGGALEQDEIELVIQVNGKLRGQISVPKSATKADIEALALADASVAKHTEGKSIKKLIVVPGRLINVVV